MSEPDRSFGEDIVRKRFQGIVAIWWEGQQLASHLMGIVLFVAVAGEKTLSGNVQCSYFLTFKKKATCFLYVWQDRRNPGCVFIL